MTKRISSSTSPFKKQQRDAKAERPAAPITATPTTEPTEPSVEAPPSATRSKRKRTYRSPKEKSELVAKVDAGAPPESLGVTRQEIYSFRSFLKQLNKRGEASRTHARVRDSQAKNGHGNESQSLEATSLEAAALALDARGVRPSQLLTSDLLFLHARRRRIGDG